MARKTDGNQVDLYKDVGLHSTYRHMSGRFVIPLATDDLTDIPFVVVQAHQQIRLKEVTYSLTKEGSPPLLPRPGDAGPLVFLGAEMDFSYPQLTAAGGFIWSASGVMTFAESSVSDADSGWVIGALPWIYSQQVANAGNGTASTFPDYVGNSGIGPKVGYTMGLQVNLANPAYQYNEPSYWPGVFSSSDLLTGSDQYPTLGQA